ncbi:MAG: CoA transferase [Candidatus Binatia bacterium]|nr:CoA transferase [Candidatus Binatia bacterium]
MNAQPLSGLRVLELGQVYNGPYCGLLLAAQGADVIKIEPPGGEILRRHDISPPGGSYSFLMLNVDKRGMTLDLKSERGREIFLQLVQKADVVVENFREDVLRDLRLTWDVLESHNPRLILASGRGYRSGSPYAGLAAMDFTIQAVSGHMAMTGFPDQPPVKAGATLADMLGASHLFGAILLALRDRDQTGRGRPVEVAMLDATFPALMSYASPYLQTGTDPGRVGNRHAVPGSAPYAAFEASDGWLTIMCVTDAQWAKFCEICGDEALSGNESFRQAPARGANRDWIEERVGAWTRNKHRAELLDLLESGGIPCAPVRSLAEAVDDPYNVEQGVLRPVDVEERGTVQALGSPIQLRDPADRDHPDGSPPRPAPKLGEHNREVLAELLDLGPAAIDALERDGIV